MYRVHRFFGKLTCVMVLVFRVFIIFMARENYHSCVVDASQEELFARRSIAWMQIFMFVLFYSLAIYYRKQPHKHLRFMMGTAIVMTGRPRARIILTYWDQTSVLYIGLIPLVVQTGIAA